MNFDSGTFTTRYVMVDRFVRAAFVMKRMSFAYRKMDADLCAA
jgi:hypothetical protein